jgi:protein O-GlcNAc transferase
MSKKSRNISGGNATLRSALLAKLVKERRHADAAELARKILAEAPTHPQALRVCIDAALSGGRDGEALPLCERLVEVAPDNVWARVNYGVCLAKSRQLADAETQFVAAEKLAPTDSEVCGNLSSLYFAFNDFERSLTYADRAITAAPGNYSAHNARGAALLKLKRYELALVSLAKAIELFSGEYYEEAVENLGLCLHDMRRYAEAYSCYEEIYRIKPEDSGTLALLVHSAMQTCQWKNIDRWLETLLHTVRGDSPPAGITPFIYLSWPGMTRTDHLRMARLAANTMLNTGVLAPPSVSALPAMLPVRERIRVGYLSADFHQHATSQLVVEVFEKSNRERFETFGYSYGPDDDSPMRQRVRASLDHFRDVHDMQWPDAVDLIREDAVDILVDLKGWTNEARLEISAVRPAPIIVSWLGYPGTLGEPGMADYIVGDPVVTPLEHAPDYSETIVQLPHTYQPNDRSREVAAMPTRSALGLPDTGTVFCSFNQAYKINREIFFAWCEILRQVPGSVLWLLQPDEVAANNMRHEFEQAGLDASRLVFSPKCKLEEHLRRLQQASVALDTAPYGSHTTGSDALWAGVPLVTCPGETFASRVAASLLTAAGVPELITSSMDAYVALAVCLGRDPDAVGNLKEKIISNRDACPLFDSARFARHLEMAYEQMLADGRQGVRRPIVVEDV